MLIINESLEPKLCITFSNVIKTSHYIIVIRVCVIVIQVTFGYAFLFFVDIPSLSVSVNA